MGISKKIATPACEPRKSIAGVATAPVLGPYPPPLRKQGTYASENRNMRRFRRDFTLGHGSANREKIDSPPGLIRTNGIKRCETGL